MASFFSVPFKLHNLEDIETFTLLALKFETRDKVQFALHSMQATGKK